MDAVFLELLNRSIAAGWLILAVVLLRLLLNRAPKNLRCLLWAFVPVRMLLPARIKSPLSLIPSARTLPPQELINDLPSIHSGIPVLDQSVNGSFSQAMAPSVENSVNPLQIWTHIWAWIWLLGFCAMLLYALFSDWRLRRLVADSLPLRDNIRLSERLSSPFVLGIARPKIYLPYGLDEDTMALVLAHEQGHILRHDHWFKPLGFLFLSFCWFHPLFWLAFLLYSRDIELACDEFVLRQLGPGAKKLYSNALLTCSASRSAVTPCPLAFGESDVKTRIRSILRYQKPTRWMLLVSGLACLVLALCFLTDPPDTAAANLPPEYSDDIVAGVPDDRADLSPFEAELLHSEAEPAYSEFSLFGYGISYDAPLLVLPEAEATLTNSEIHFTWDNNMGLLRHKELWFDEEKQEVLVAHWITDLNTMDPEYAQGLWQYPSYDWAQQVQEYSFSLYDTLVYLRYYTAGPPSLDLPSVASGASFRSPQRLAAEQYGQSYPTMLLALMRYEIHGTYSPISREELSAQEKNLSLISLPPESTDLTREWEPLYIMGRETGLPRVTRIWYNAESGSALFASQRRNPESTDTPMSMSYNRSITSAFLDCACFMAESRGTIDGYDVVMRFYSFDPNYDPENCRPFMEHPELIPISLP